MSTEPSLSVPEDVLYNIFRMHLQILQHYGPDEQQALHNQARSIARLPISHRPIEYRLIKAAYNAGYKAAQGSMLGLATTRDLLNELKARGENERYYEAAGDAIAIGAAELLDNLPNSMLEYKPAKDN